MISSDCPYTNNTSPIIEESELFQRIDIPDSKEKSTIRLATDTISQFAKILCINENRKTLAGVTVLTSLAMANRFIAPLLLGKVFESFSNKNGFAHIAGVELSKSALLTSAIASSALSPLLSCIQNRVCEHLQWNVMQQLIEKSITHFLQRSLDFHTHTSVTEMFNLIQKAFSLQGLGVTLLTQIFPTLIETCIAASLLSYQFGVPVGGSVVLLIVVFTLYSAWMTKKIVSMREEVIDTWNKTFQTMGEILSRYKLMRDCNRFENTQAILDQSLKNLKTIDLKASKTSVETHIGYILLSYLHMLAITFYISKYSDTKKLIPLIGYLGNFASLLPSFGHGMTQLFTLYPDLKFVFSKLSMPSDIIDPYPDTPLLLDRAPEIIFENVQFQYPTQNGYLFQDLSFKIPAGSKVALLSRSGGGKTSIFQLLYRYYAPKEGCIRINGQDISKVSLDSLQTQICLLGQQAILFQGTIRDNILYGAPNPEAISDEALHRLADSVGFGDFFGEFPDRLDKDVGEGGKALSGGQQQKVALLRSLLKTTKLRLLDEATASLDNLSAAKMLDALLDRTQDVTTLMITHKLTEARKAEMILFLEDGNIIAQGTHEELLKTCNPYLEMWQSQEHKTEG